MTIVQAKEIHDILIQDRWIEAGNKVMSLLGRPPTVKSRGESLKICRDLCQFLLDREMYLVAATLLWGSDMFNAEPESVQRVFNALHKNAKILFMGASSMGKSYNAGVWMYLDWRRDPLYTSIKCVGVSEDQVRKHVFSHIVKLHRSCAIPMSEQVDVRDSDMWMGVKEAGYEFGITAIAYKQSQETSGGIKGYKSMPVRKVPHPQFGMYSRLRLLGDEGQNWPNGPFKDIQTWVSQIDGPEKVKIAIAFNPENMSQLVVQMSEHENGWDINDMEVLYDWDSKFGWRVCRLDAAKSENVIQRKTVCLGLQTYEGYLGYLKAGGDGSANFSCFARGWPPMKGSVNAVIPPAWVQSQRGEATFIENPQSLAAVDLAFMGKDTARMAVGRWGLASGWRDHMGTWHQFTDRINIATSKPRHVLQIDQILPMSFHEDTVRMSEEIMARAKNLKITPDWVAIDKTGVGFGVDGHLNKVWGPVFGIGWAEKATAGKILAEDLQGADEQVGGVMSEMWWTFRRWLDPMVSSVLINPIIPPQPINTQLTSRRYRNGKNGKIVVESKEEYKARNTDSPDEADAMIMLAHLVRRKGTVLPGLVEQQKATAPSEGGIQFQEVHKMKSIDSDDSISGGGTDLDHLEDAVA